MSMDEKIALEIKNLKKYFPVKKGFFKRTVGLSLIHISEPTRH